MRQGLVLVFRCHSPVPAPFLRFPQTQRFHSLARSQHWAREVATVMVTTAHVFGAGQLSRFDMSEFQTQDALGLLLGARLGKAGYLGDQLEIAQKFPARAIEFLASHGHKLELDATVLPFLVRKPACRQAGAFTRSSAPAPCLMRWINWSVTPWPIVRSRRGKPAASSPWTKRALASSRAEAREHRSTLPYLASNAQNCSCGSCRFDYTIPPTLTRQRQPNTTHDTGWFEDGRDRWMRPFPEPATSSPSR